jgi:hypothetical protein
MSETQPQMAHEESIESQNPNLQSEKKTKNRRPANTAFRQQRLKAWQPILTPKTVLPLFFAIGIIFAPIGGLLLYASAQVQEIILDYTNCFEDAGLGEGNYITMPPNLITTAFKHNSTSSSAATWSRKTIQYAYAADVIIQTTQCSIRFTIPSDMSPPILYYYRLTNFYQNHRRYVKSFNGDQLQGKAVSAGTINGSDCAPLTSVGDKPYYPCGLVANSVFNDTFYNPVLLNVPNSSADNQTYYMTNSSGISWESDKALYGNTSYRWDEVSVPPNWVERYPNGYSDNYHPNLVTDEGFQVWMRTAGLPTFSKLAQRNDTATMISGQYQIDIDHHFNVIEYGGTKAVIISTRTVMGGKNPFLGIAYVVVGGICIVLGALFTVTHLIKPRKLGDHTYLSWNNDQPSTATASGREVRPDDSRPEIA